MTERAGEQAAVEQTADSVDRRQVRPKNVGARVRRTEDPRLLVGRGIYADDRRVHRPLHVAFRRSDHAHARIAAIDTGAARAFDGVAAVLTADDLADVETLFAASRMTGYYATPLRALASGKVRFVGEPIVAVVAESRYIAEDACEHVEVALDPLPAVGDPVAALAASAALLHEEAGSNVLVRREFERGAFAVEMAAAPVRVRRRFRFHRKSPCAIENRCCLAEYDAGRDELTLHSSTQVPGIVRNALCQAIGLPGHRLRVIAPEVGGGFGGKASLYPEELLVAVAARRLGRPVKWTSDRIEDLLATSHGFDEIVDAELGLDDEGRVLALTADVIGDVGAYSIYPWTCALEPVQVASFLPGPYRIQNYRATVAAVATAKAPTGPYRGVGRPIAAFVTERLLDIAARRLGIDAREIRLRNLVRDAEFPYRIGSGIVWDRSAFREGLLAACQAVDYDGLRRRQAEARAAGRLFGIGIACYAELTGIGSRISVAPGMPLNTGTETARICIDALGGITAAFGIAAHGQGHETTLAQLVADKLGVRVEDVRIVHGDSAVVANATGSFASRSTVLAGGAATLAARSLRGKVFKAAAHLLEAAPDELAAEDGRIFVPGTNKATTFTEVARAVYRDIGRLPAELRAELDSSATYDPVFGTTSSATHVVVLEVDPEICGVRLEKIAVAEDCGRLINPLIVEGQVHGGVVQGIGAALHEEVVYDDQGQLLTASLVDYLLPLAGDVPPISVTHLESASPAIGGFRGMGEGGTIGTPAAIANALADALSPLGIEIDELPVTPERLFRLLEAARAQMGGAHDA
jgi:carbon-monoxide dehydrogenase large subunit